MSEILWKAGEEYRTRDGSRARVYATDGAGPAVIHGAIFVNGEWRIRKWHANGRWAGYEEHANDLMPPKRVIWVNVYESDGVHRRWGYLYPTREIADVRAVGDRVACIRVEYTPGQFDE